MANKDRLMLIIGSISLLVSIGALFYYYKKKNNSKSDDPSDASWLLESSEPFRNQVRSLFNKDSGWEDIFSVLNPGKSKDIERMLIDFRGPHMFTPHIALNILEKCLQKLEDQETSIDSVALLEMALKEGEKVIGFHK